LKITGRRSATNILGFRTRWSPGLKKNLYNQGWEAFGLYDFPYGRELPFAAMCSFTRDLIKEHIPTHGVAGFSRLVPVPN
jgi:hypothetical protein